MKDAVPVGGLQAVFDKNLNRLTASLGLRIFKKEYREREERMGDFYL